MIYLIAFREGAPYGRTRLITASVYTGTEAMSPGTVSRYDGASIRNMCPQMLASDTTFVCGSNTCFNHLMASGFSNVVNLSGVTAQQPWRLYYGPNYIEMWAENDAPVVVYHDTINERVFHDQSHWPLPADSALSIPAAVPQLVSGANGWFTSGWRVWGWTLASDAYYYCDYWPMASSTDEPYKSYLTAFYEAVPRVDPYAPGTISGPGGGTGTFTRTTIPIDFPGEPVLSATDTGFVTLFCPGTTELKALADYMWTNPSFDPASWRKLLTDPMDAILGLSIVPVVPDMAASPSAVTVGNIPTSVTMHRITSQYKTVDCGTLEIPEYWGAYLDYDPYTKLELYLPYCGTHAISADDCMGKVLHLKYVIDLLSGACCAMLKCGDSILYTFIGQCSSAVPVTGRDWTNIINGVMSAASSVGTMVATGGVGALSAVGGLASAALNVIKPHIEKSGNMGGTGGLLAPQIPYIVLTQPKQAAPADQNQFTGYPSFITRKVDDLRGYTEFEVIHLEGVPCTGEEQDELASLLKEGVIL